MGEDKSRLRIGGRTFVERIAEELSPHVCRVSLVRSREDADGHGRNVGRDIHTGCGALGGVHAALADCRTSRAFVVSCDLPFVTSELFGLLAADSLQQEIDAVAPVQDDGRQQPLCAVYAQTICLPVAEELIRAGELRPRFLLRRVRTRRVAFDELSKLEGSKLFFRNINTPEDYEKAKVEREMAKENR